MEVNCRGGKMIYHDGWGPSIMFLSDLLCLRKDPPTLSTSLRGFSHVGMTWLVYIRNGLPTIPLGKPFGGCHPQCFPCSGLAIRYILWNERGHCHDPPRSWYNRWRGLEWCLMLWVDYYGWGSPKPSTWTTSLKHILQSY